MTTWHQALLTAQPHLAGYPEHHRSRNSIHFQRPDGLIEAHISAGPVFYPGAGGLWLPINPVLGVAGEYWEPEGIPIRIHRATGRVECPELSYQQQTVAAGWFREGQFTGVGNMTPHQVAGNTVYIESANFRFEIEVSEVGIREWLTLQRRPPGGSQAEWFGLKTRIEGPSWSPGWLLDQPRIGDYVVAVPTVVDAAGDSPECRQWVAMEDGQQYLYTLIPTDWLETAQYPVVLDPDFVGASNTRINGQNATVAVARSTAYAHSTSTLHNAGQNYGSPNYYIYRWFLKFDTASIDDAATIDSANLKLTIGSDFSELADFDIQIVEQNWGAYDPIDASNRDAAYDDCLSPSAYVLLRNTSGIEVNTVYTSAALTPSYINKTGATYFSVRSSRDKNENTPTGYEYVSFRSVTFSEPSYRPTLVVTYTTGSSSIIPIVDSYARRRQLC